MYDIEKDEFEALLRDLCIAVDRPWKPELARVFWDDLRNVPMSEVRTQVFKLRRAGKRQFTSNDLLPSGDESPMMQSPENTNEALMDRIISALIKLGKMPGGPVTWLYAGKCGGIPGHRITGCEVHGERFMINDLAADQFMEERQAVRDQMRANPGADFNEAAAVKDLLERR